MWCSHQHVLIVIQRDVCLHWVGVESFSGSCFCSRSEDGLCGVVGVDLAGDPWTATCYLLPVDRGGVGLLSVNTGRAEEGVLRLPYHKVALWNGSKILLTQYYDSKVFSSLPWVVRAFFCVSLLYHLIGSTDLWGHYLGSLITIEGFINLHFLFAHFHICRITF